MGTTVCETIYKVCREANYPALFAILAARMVDRSKPRLSPHDDLMCRGLVVARQDQNLTILDYPTARRRNLVFGADAVLRHHS